jgi:hypothetical protein
MTDTEKDPTDREILWRQYNLYVDLYKFYIDLVLKANAFFYLITGGIVTYFLTNAKEPQIKYALILPILMSISLGGGFIYGSSLLSIQRKDLFALSNKLGLGTAPELKILGIMLQISGLIFFMVGVALTVLIAIK